MATKLYILRLCKKGRRISSSQNVLFSFSLFLYGFFGNQACLLLRFLMLFTHGGSALGKAFTYKGQDNTEKRRQTSMPSGGFGPTIPISKRSRHTVDRAVTVNGNSNRIRYRELHQLWKYTPWTGSLFFHQDQQKGNEQWIYSESLKERDQLGGQQWTSEFLKTWRTSFPVKWPSCSQLGVSCLAEGVNLNAGPPHSNTPGTSTVHNEITTNWQNHGAILVYSRNKKQRDQRHGHTFTCALLFRSALLRLAVSTWHGVFDLISLAADDGIRNMPHGWAAVASRSHPQPWGRFYEKRHGRWAISKSYSPWRWQPSGFLCP
jgi:hypothetical protein